MGLGFSPPADSAERVLFERIRTLYAHLNYARRHKPEYEHLSAKIRELSRAYDTLVDARLGINRPDPKP